MAASYFEYFHVLPIAILFAFLANSSGFSGGVLFQPLFYFYLNLPLPASIATGIATETIGMSSGAFRYWKMRMIDWAQFRNLIPWIFVGNLMGLFLFQSLPVVTLRLILGLILVLLSVAQLIVLWRKLQISISLQSPFLAKVLTAFSGFSSALTGTGQAELMQPFLAFVRRIDVRKANATAIAIEASGNLLISFFNLKTGNIRFDILLWTGLGVLFGAQLGAHWSLKIPEKFLRLSFSLLVLGIGLFYLYRSWM